MAWQRTGNIRGPQGTQGAPGAVGATGVQGAQGPAGPGLAAGGAVGSFLVKTGAADYQTGWQALRRWWLMAGDNSGDSANTSNTVFSTVKSPVFTCPTAGWYRVMATFSLLCGTTAMPLAGAVMIDAAVSRMLYTTPPANGYAAFSLNPAMQLTVGQKVTIGYRPTSSGKSMSLVNSNSIVPLLLVEEMTAPQ